MITVEVKGHVYRTNVTAKSLQIESAQNSCTQCLLHFRLSTIGKIRMKLCRSSQSWPVLPLLRSLILLLSAGLSANASAIADGQTLQAGDVRITELMAKVEGNDGSWFELLNTTDHDVDLHGCTLSSGDDEQFVLQAPLRIFAGDYSVFASDRSNLALLTEVAGAVAYEYRSAEFELTGGPDTVSLSCNERVIDTVRYARYRPGAATQSRGWQLAPGVLDATATAKDISWCFTGLPILSEDYLYGDDNVASPGRANPRCTENVLPYLYINDQSAVLLEGIDFAQTLKVAQAELERNLATAPLTIWALRDQVVTPQVAGTIAALYLANIDRLYTAETVTLIDWNHAVWHFAWAIANLYRNGDEAVKAQLQLAYDDAKNRHATLERFQLVALDHAQSEDISMGNAHEAGFSYAKTHLVVPGNPLYLQSFEQYLEDRPSDFAVAVIGVLFELKVFFESLFDWPAV